MKLFKYLTVLIGLMTLTTACEEEFDLTDEQQVIEALLYQPVDHIVIKSDDGYVNMSLKTDVRNVCTHDNELLSDSHWDGSIMKENYYTVDVNTLRQELVIEDDGRISYNGEEVFAIEDIRSDGLRIFRIICICTSEEESIAELEKIASDFGCTLRTFSDDVYFLYLPLGLKAAYMQKYLMKHISNYKFIEVSSEVD